MSYLLHHETLKWRDFSVSSFIEILPHKEYRGCFKQLKRNLPVPRGHGWILNEEMLLKLHFLLIQALHQVSWNQAILWGSSDTTDHQHKAVYTAKVLELHICLCKLSTLYFVCCGITLEHGKDKTNSSLSSFKGTNIKITECRWLPRLFLSFLLLEWW